ncbi:MAG: hypothetical protein MUO99_03470, partial [Dehalococcoidales bacterium]|nr:hypothetical protein [Dehalococcoidales bacterium]
TSDRPYRPAMPVEEARREIRRCVGTQFDLVVASAFLGIGVFCTALEKGKAAIVMDTPARP